MTKPTHDHAPFSRETELLAELDALKARFSWNHDMESAPKSHEILVKVRTSAGERTALAMWLDDNTYAGKPQPRWEWYARGLNESRSVQPHAWMEIPTYEPEQEVDGLECTGAWHDEAASIDMGSREPEDEC